MDSLRRPVPIIQFVPAMGVPVELNDPPQLQTGPPAQGLQTSRFGLLPTRRRKAPQRAEKHLATSRNLEPLENSSTNNQPLTTKHSEPQRSSQTHSLRLLPGVPRQSCPVAINTQLLRAPRAQLV